MSLVYADAAHLSGRWNVLARNSIPLAAILMSAGLFLSAMGRELNRPNRFIIMLYAGILSWGLGVTPLGIGLLTT